MVKKHYVLSITSFLLIPAVSVLGGMVFISINPEIAAGTPNYVRNYRLLDLAKNFTLLAILLVNMGLWFLTCFFLLKSKKQSYWWLLLAMLGPFGFIVLAILNDNAADYWNLHHQFVCKLNITLRVAYELCVFLAVWVFAFQFMVLKRDLMIMVEAAATGVSTTQIINQQNASSGMWAFTEGLEVLFLVVFLYLFWPICFNLIGHLPKLWSSPKKV
jgi:hypothetical protein